MRRMVVGGALLAAVIALGGCAANEAGSAGEDAAVPEGAYDVPALPAGPLPADEDAAVGDADGAPRESSAGGAAESDRSVVVTGTATVTVDDPLEAAREAVRIVEAAGGRVDARQELAPTEFDGGRARLTLRIPADGLTATLEELRALGRADAVELSSSDVTVERQDLDARISALRSSISRFTALMAEADEVDDLIALESELASRQAELESLEARQRFLADQVSMSTISLELRTEAEAPRTGPGDFVEGVATGWDAFVAFWAGLLVVLGVLAPWLALLGLAALVVVLIVRRRRRIAATAAGTAADEARAAAAPESS